MNQAYTKILRAEEAHNLVFSQCTEAFAHDGRWDLTKEAQEMEETRIINFNSPLQKIEARINAKGYVKDTVETELRNKICQVVDGNDCADNAAFNSKVTTDTLKKFSTPGNDYSSRKVNDIREHLLNFKLFLQLSKTDKSQWYTDGMDTATKTMLKACEKETNNGFGTFCAGVGKLHLFSEVELQANQMLRRRVNDDHYLTDVDTDDDLVVYTKEDERKEAELQEMKDQIPAENSYWTHEFREMNIEDLDTDLEYYRVLKTFRDKEKAWKEEPSNQANKDICLPTSDEMVKYNQYRSIDDDTMDPDTAGHPVITGETFGLKARLSNKKMAEYRALTTLHRYCKRKHEYMIEILSDEHMGMKKYLEHLRFGADTQARYREFYKWWQAFRNENGHVVTRMEIVKDAYTGVDLNKANLDVNAIKGKLNAVKDAINAKQTKTVADNFKLEYIPKGIQWHEDKNAITDADRPKFDALNELIKGTGMCKWCLPTDGQDCPKTTCEDKIATWEYGVSSYPKANKDPSAGFYPFTSVELKNHSAQSAYLTMYYDQMNRYQQELLDVNDNFWSQADLTANTDYNNMNIKDYIIGKKADKIVNHADACKCKKKDGSDYDNNDSFANTIANCEQSIKDIETHTNPDHVFNPDTMCAMAKVEAYNQFIHWYEDIQKPIFDEINKALGATDNDLTKVLDYMAYKKNFEGADAIKQNGPLSVGAQAEYVKYITFILKKKMLVINPDEMMKKVHEQTPTDKLDGQCRTLKIFTRVLDNLINGKDKFANTDSYKNQFMITQHPKAFQEEFYGADNNYENTFFSDGVEMLRQIGQVYQLNDANNKANTQFKMTWDNSQQKMVTVDQRNKAL